LLALLLVLVVVVVVPLSLLSPPPDGGARMNPCVCANERKDRIDGRAKRGCLGVGFGAHAGACARASGVVHGVRIGRVMIAAFLGRCPRGRLQRHRTHEGQDKKKNTNVLPSTTVAHQACRPTWYMSSGKKLLALTLNAYTLPSIRSRSPSPS
jgi:hypothetical protein